MVKAMGRLTSAAIGLTAVIFAVSGCGSDEGEAATKESASVSGRAPNGTKYTLSATAQGGPDQWRICEQLRLVTEKGSAGSSRRCERHSRTGSLHGQFRYDCASEGVSLFGSAPPHTRSVRVESPSARDVKTVRPAENGPVAFVFQGTRRELPVRLAATVGEETLVRSDAFKVTQADCASRTFGPEAILIEDF